MMTIWKNPYIDVTYTGEWKFKKQIWIDTHHFVEYYFGPLLIRYFYETMETNSDSVQ